MAAAADTTCALLGDGTVRCWGGNTYGAVGDGTTTDRPLPTPVAGLANATQIALGPKHACARLGDGGVACWGNGFYGQLGPVPIASPPPGVVARQGDTSVSVLMPQRLPGLTHVVDISVGERLTCARLATRDVTCFGQPYYRARADPTPRVVPALHGATALALGTVNHCGLLHGGVARCWGANIGGELLDGTRTERPEPVPSTGLPPVSTMCMSTVSSRVCAIGGGSGGEVQCWGESGTVGVGGLLRQVALPIAAAQVALGANHGCALGGDGAVWCWGDRFWGATGARDAQAAPTSAFWTPPQRVAF
ncbi:RCC1 domain-containing protein [Nannocystis pusilla]|uniref:RCC1 domain-containing protein n=1 Tax=Nannocystis pusilla TaxID=889268 RepID=UPI003B775B56